MRILNRRRLSPDADPDPTAVYVGRGSPWGNPYPIVAGVRTRAQSIALYRTYAQQRLRDDPHWLDPLLCASALVCWCAPLPCHAQVLVELMEHERWLARRS